MQICVPKISFIKTKDSGKTKIAAFEGCTFNHKMNISTDSCILICHGEPAGGIELSHNFLVPILPKSHDRLNFLSIQDPQSFGQVPVLHSQTSIPVHIFLLQHRVSRFRHDVTVVESCLKQVVEARVLNNRVTHIYVRVFMAKSPYPIHLASSSDTPWRHKLISDQTSRMHVKPILKGSIWRRGIKIVITDVRAPGLLGP